MGKKLFKKLLSGAAASMMIFGASPKNNTKAVRHSSSNDLVTTCVAGVALAGVAIGVGVACYLESKAWKEELNRREGLISNANNYIKDLASELKEKIPRSNSDLFNSLVNCRNYSYLRNWQTKVCNCDNLNSSTLNKIINCLRNHWIEDLKKHSYDIEYASYCADIEVWQLCNKYEQLVDEERWKEHMKLEKEKLDIEKAKTKNDRAFIGYPSRAGAKGGNNIVINNYGNNYYPPSEYYY